MGTDYLAIAENYYRIVGEKKIEPIEKYLHPEVQFIAPLAKLKGKDAVLETTKKFASFFINLTIRAKFCSGNQAVVVYDVDCPAPVGKISSAALMTFQEDLIVKIELFYDARAFS